jgi:hypothetical protein
LTFTQVRFAKLRGGYGQLEASGFSGSVLSLAGCGGATR